MRDLTQNHVLHELPRTHLRPVPDDNSSHRFHPSIHFNLVHQFATHPRSLPPILRPPQPDLPTTSLWPRPPRPASLLLLISQVRSDPATLVVGGAGSGLT